MLRVKPLVPWAFGIRFKVSGLPFTSLEFGGLDLALGPFQEVATECQVLPHSEVGRLH